MKLCYYTDSLGYMPFGEMLDTVKALGVDTIEVGTGNWSGAPHLDLDEMLSSETARTNFLEELKKRDMQLGVLNCSGNPLCYQEHMDVTLKTFRLSEYFGLKKVVMMSGLPAGCAGDKTPTWITTSWPPETQTILDYQWNEVAIPAWEKLITAAKNHGIEQIALENHGFQLVYNPETLLRLREAVGPTVGMNLDPSHMFWMGGDPIAAARALGSAIYHVHGKDSRPERLFAAQQGMLDTKTIDRFAERSWNYVAVSCGHDLQWWKEFISVVRMCGYDGYVSLEMEDLTMSALAGVKTSLRALRDCIE